ncbi:MAG: adenylate/guanylate cyclase domain-containing protein [Pseudomonadota bacterium]
MSHATLITEIEDWLIGKALGDPDVVVLFENLCNRLHGLGIPLDRTAMSWPTLHPLFRAERVFWHRDKGVTLEQYTHGSDYSAEWLASPFYHMITHELSHIRRRLTGPGALLDFDVLKDFQTQGFTDYLLTSTKFGIAEVEQFSGGRTGMMASWTTKRDGGFTDDDLDALRRIQKLLSVAVRASIQRRVMDNLGSAYLGPTAGHRVLTGDIKLGDGARIPAVVWYSDLRGSTRLSDTMDPDSYLQLLNQYFACTASKVIENGGEILNFIGDGVLAIFPVHESCPLGASAKAEKAARAAIEAAADANKTGTPGGAPLSFGIALAVGDVMFGNIGVPDRLAFSGIGRVVNKVQRIETHTKVLEIPVLATPEFAEAAPGNWISAGEMELPDFDRRLEVFTMSELAHRPSGKKHPKASRTVAE